MNQSEGPPDRCNGRQGMAFLLSGPVGSMLKSHTERFTSRAQQLDQRVVANGQRLAGVSLIQRFPGNA